MNKVKFKSAVMYMKNLTEEESLSLIVESPVYYHLYIPLYTQVYSQMAGLTTGTLYETVK